MARKPNQQQNTATTAGSLRQGRTTSPKSFAPSYWGSGLLRRTRPCSTYTKPYWIGESGGATPADARCV